MSDSLKIGDQAPQFKAKSTNGKTVTLDDFAGKWVIIYFYPKAFTPGCTAESCTLRDGYSQIQNEDAVILGVSLDDIKAQQKFKAKHNLPFDLLSDSSKEMAKAYGVLGLLGLYTKRKTFIIDPNGIIQFIFDKVHVKNHDDDILEALQKLQK